MAFFGNIISSQKYCISTNKKPKKQRYSIATWPDFWFKIERRRKNKVSDNKLDWKQTTKMLFRMKSDGNGYLPISCQDRDIFVIGIEHNFYDYFLWLRNCCCFDITICTVLAMRVFGGTTEKKRRKSHEKNRKNKGKKNKFFLVKKWKKKRNNLILMVSVLGTEILVKKSDQKMKVFCNSRKNFV